MPGKHHLAPGFLISWGRVSSKLIFCEEGGYIYKSYFLDQCHVLYTAESDKLMMITTDRLQKT